MHQISCPSTKLLKGNESNIEWEEEHQQASRTSVARFSKRIDSVWNRNRKTMESILCRIGDQRIDSFLVSIPESKKYDKIVFLDI